MASLTSPAMNVKDEVILLLCGRLRKPRTSSLNLPDTFLRDSAAHPILQGREQTQRDQEPFPRSLRTAEPGFEPEFVSLLRGNSYLL